jgi:peptidoglycan/xylan/chitin deacetylase (PgdA/CDA1 family)
MASTPQPGRTPKTKQRVPVGRPPLRVRWDRVNVLVALMIVIVTVLVHALVVAIRDNLAAVAPPPAATKVPKAPPAATQAPEAPAATQPPEVPSTPTQAAAAPPEVNTHPACPSPASGAIRTAPVRHGPADQLQRTVALTFDDGPGPSTPEVLDVLQQHGVPATFFVVGRNAAAEPEMLQRIVAEGHALGNHTWSHHIPSAKAGWKASTLNREIERTRRAILNATGREPCLFRPPGGITKGARAVTRAAGLSMIMWSVDTRDWSAPPNGEFAPVIRSRAATGLKEERPVILLHDGAGNQAATVAALPAIINDYRSHGYQFVSLAEPR